MVQELIIFFNLFDQIVINKIELITNFSKKQVYAKDEKILSSQFMKDPNFLNKNTDLCIKHNNNCYVGISG